MKRTTIFSQLVINIIIPVIMALIALAFFNYVSTKNILENSNRNKNSIISNEIKTKKIIGKYIPDNRMNKNFLNLIYNYLLEFF